MPNVNPTNHNYLCNSIDFNSSLIISSLPHGVDPTAEFAHIPVFPTELNFSGEFAIHAWINASASCSMHSRIIQTPAFGENEVTNAFMLGLLGDDTFYSGSNNALRIGMGTDNNGETQDVKVTRLPVLKPNNWHHIVGQVVIGEPNTIEIYVDGCKRDLIDHPDLDYSLTTNTGGTDATGLVIGWDANLDGPFKGPIASLAIFNRALTSEEIETLAQGTINLIGVSQSLKSSLVSWWKMGDKDPANISQLLDSVNTNHLTTINMGSGNLLIDIPPEAPRKHHCLHMTTGADEIQFEPYGMLQPYMWETFHVLDDPDVFPLGWFGSKHADDKFSTTSLLARLSPLLFTKINTTVPMFITNVSSTSTMSTLDFNAGAEIDNVDYCMEVLMQFMNNSGTNTVIIGFVNNPHGFTNADPDQGIYIRINASSGAIDLIVSNGGNQTVVSAGIVLTSGIFYRMKLCFIVYPAKDGSEIMRAELKINRNIPVVALVPEASNTFPNDNGDVLIGIHSATATCNIGIEWILITFRGSGAGLTVGI